MKIFKSGTLFLLFIVLVSCNQTSNKELAMMAPRMDEASYANEQAVINPVEAIIERKVIKRGDISFQTNSIEETTGFITTTVKELDGYISNENVYNSDNRTTQRLEIRVPAPSFDELLNRISQKARRIDSKNVQVQDVTEEYIDIESRIRTKKELESRFKELLSMAKTVEEILSIEKELGTLRTDIEAIEGRLKYLKDQVSLSTLSVEYYELTSSTLNFSSKIGQALIMGWRLLLGFIIGIVHLWPFLIIIGITLFIILRISRKKNKRLAR